MTILLTNDDGIQAEAIELLYAKLGRLGKVYVVAPEREMSAVSHALTIRDPLRATKVKEDFFAVDGTPTDCVNIALNGFLPVRPDLVVSGINKGPNLGDDITYSGTVAAAMEGTLLGVRSIAFSLEGRTGYNFEEATDIAVAMVADILVRDFPPDTLLNVNIPNRPKAGIKGIRVAKLGKRYYEDEIVEKTDPRGRRYYWIGGSEIKSRVIPDTDIDAVDRGYVSVTPIHLDLTNYSAINTLIDWGLSLT